MIDGQLNIFEVLYPKFKIDKPIRLIELFGGYGSQALALKYLGVKFEHWKLCEWAIKSIQAYKDIHMGNNNTDYSKNLSKEEIINILFDLGISQNYNEPMSLNSIKRLSENQLRTIYNNIKATNNLVNIQQVKGSDMLIKDTDKFTYLLTYSFPCQDLSLAGNRALMSDTSTRSGLLWEVERVLSECENKPQVLLMENVPQVHGDGALDDFIKWQNRLEELGYKNYWQDLIATDYGIPQTRNRCFMVSVLGNYNYTFPKPTPLKLRLKDLFENINGGKIKINSNRKINGKYKIIKNTNNYIEWHVEGKLDMDCRAWKEEKVIGTLMTNGEKNKILKKNLTIRNLTTKECFRLMGVKDEDFKKVEKNQTNASLYHLAGDSIVVNVLMAIFREMIK